LIDLKHIVIVGLRSWEERQQDQNANETMSARRDGRQAKVLALSQ
jgi:hypothetical protein